MDALRDLEVWRRACRLSVDTYRMLAACRNALFRDQLGRSVLSIASNIAEGYERGGRNERLQFLRFAKGSCGEAWTQMLVGIEAGILPRATGLQLADEARQIAAMIAGLMKHIESSAVS